MEAAGLGGTSLRNVSKEQGVYDYLRNAIVSGALTSGQRLIPGEIGAQLGVSPMPVRAALMRLEAEYLITRTPHRDFLVAESSASEVEELYAVRAALQGYAAGLAARKATAEQIAHLTEIVERAEGHLLEGKTDDLVATNLEFHEAVNRMAGNVVLLQVVRSLQDRSNRYRLAYYGQKHVPRRTVEAHRAIIAALARRDVEAAETLVRQDFEAISAWLTHREAAETEVS